MLRCSTILFFLSVCSFVCIAQTHQHDRVVTPHVSPSLKFTENLGQWDPRILCRAQLDGGALFLEKDALTFSFYDKKKFRALHHGGILKNEYKDQNLQFHAYRVNFENCNPLSALEKRQPGSDYENFFIGNDKKSWASGVKNYHQVFLRDLYKGIDYEVLTAVNGIKYNFHVKAGTDPSVIRMRYEGIGKIKEHEGTISIKLDVNEVVEQKPYAYQLINGRVKVVPCLYRVKNNVVSFEFPDGYDRTKDLVIDPVLVFAAQSGSSADNFGMTATYDAAGNLYSGGTVFGNGYPVTIGSFSANFTGSPASGITDVCITKYSSNGTNLLYSTYIGGSQAEIVTSLVVDNQNNLCFYGATGSSNFPMTSGTFDNTFNGGSFLSFLFNGTTFQNGTDIYLGKFNPAGTTLMGCTFLGGSGNDGVNHVNHLTQINLGGGNFVNEFVQDSLQFNYGDQYRGEIQTDILNNIYITSSTRSSDFPMSNPLDSTLGGKQDAIVAKFNPALTQLIYCTYLGGSKNDCGNSLIVDNNFEVYVTGGTCSNDFTTTVGAHKTTYGGGKTDGFIVHLNATGKQALQSTYVGTTNYDQPYFIQTDKYKNIYVYGQSLGNMPVLKASNAATVFSVTGTHQFITRYNSTLSTINLSTVFGNFTNNTDISPCAFSVDKCNNVYVSGWGGDVLGQGPPMANMPLLNPTQATTDGRDFYFMGLDSNFQALKYGSYFGGGLSSEHVDGGTSRFDPGGKIYQSVCAGCGGNDDFPVTTGAWPNTPGNPNHSFNCNNGVVKLDFQLQMAVSTIHTATMAGCVPVVMQFTNATPATSSVSSFIWYLAPGVTNTTNPNPTMTYTAPGVYTVALVVRDSLTCNKKDSTITFITVYAKPTATFTVNTTPCSNAISIINSSTGNLGSNPHSWNFGNGNTSTVSAPSYTYPGNGNYVISYSLTDVNGCRAVSSQSVSIFNFAPGAVTSASTCAGVGVTITASGGTNYTWTPSAGLSNTSVAAPVANPNTTTTYSVIIFNNTPGYNCTATLTTVVNVLPNPVSGFAVTANPCSNKVNTSNSSSGNLGTNPYLWDFGDGSPLVSATAPSYTYQSNGTFTVSLLVTDQLGCKNLTTQTVTVFNFTPGLVSTASLCAGQSTTLNASGGTSYTWAPAGLVNNPNSPSPTSNPMVTTVYTVQIDNNSPGYTCSSTLTTQIEVFPTPTTNFVFNINECGGGVFFIDQSFDDIVSWQWTLTPTRTSTIQFPYHFYPNGGDYTISLVTTNIHGCKSQLDKPLKVGAPPPLTVSDSVAICRGDSAQLSASGGIAYEWTPPQSLDFPNMANPVATPTITTEYSVNITTSLVVNGNQCKFLLTTVVRVDILSNVPIGAYATPTLVVVGDPTTLIYTGQAGSFVQWLPLGTTTPLTGYTVVAYPDRPTTYTAVAQRGSCREEVVVHVDAYTEGCTINDFFVPNTFTPNGDSENDLLFVRGLKIDDVYFAVYNRWGEMVFETQDKNMGWDGRYKGKDADVGVFGWYLRAKCINGLESFHKGNVTLIR